MRQLIVAMVLLALEGCSTNKVTTFEKVNPDQKTALVDPGTYGVLGVLKENLRKNGWALIVSRGNGVVAPV
jgi:hypothetical protein